MADLIHSLERTIVIRAPRETVFSFFTTNDRWASWWGAGSSIDPRPGGKILIRYPGGVEAGGEVVEIASPDRIVFTFGFASGQPMPSGASRVTIALSAAGDATRVVLRHDLSDPALMAEFEQGWRYQLSLFTNAVSDVVQARAADVIDAWFDAWAAAPETIGAALATIAAPQVEFRDRFSAVSGLRDLVPHIAAAQRFMPGLRMRRQGSLRHCQGMALVDWIAAGEDGQARGQGTNVFVFDEQGRVESVRGFWS